MTVFDFTPLFRTAIGFDRLARVMDSAQEAAAASNGYPPYNIEKTGDDSYRLTMAVAGFAPADIEISSQEGTLSVRGRIERDAADERVLYRGIAGRSFERRFALADYIVVEEAQMEHGLLHVGLKRVVPEALKPRSIAITSGSPASRPIPALEAGVTDAEVQASGA